MGATYKDGMLVVGGMPFAVSYSYVKQSDHIVVMGAEYERDKQSSTPKLDSSQSDLKTTPVSRKELAGRVLEDLHMIDNATDQYAVEHNKESGTTVFWADIKPYLKPGSRLATSGGKDCFGNRFNDGDHFRIDHHPVVADATFSALRDVVSADFWSPYCK